MAEMAEMSRNGVPYLVDIEANSHFRGKFCLKKNGSGEPLLTRWSEDGNHCTDEPLNNADKPQ